MKNGELKDRSIDEDNQLIRRVTYIGVFDNVVLAILKITVGFFAGSMSLMADGIHSVSDMATDVAVLVGTHFGSKRPDPKHPYGHGRVETFSAMFVAFVLAVVGGGMIYNASLAIARLQYEQEAVGDIGWPVLLVALISVVVKEYLYRATKKVSLKVHSPALYANAWHHRSDAFSSVAVAIGFISCRFGYRYGDQVATVAVGLMIIWVAVKVIRGCVDEFTESAVDAGTVEQIEKIISGEHRIHQWHKLRTRNVGREIFLDMHILVDPDMNITEAHEVADSLEQRMHEQMSRPINIMVHIEPDTSEFRK